MHFENLYKDARLDIGDFHSSKDYSKIKHLKSVDQHYILRDIVFESIRSLKLSEQMCTSKINVYM